MTTPIGSKLVSITVDGKIIDAMALDLSGLDLTGMGVNTAELVVGMTKEGDDLILITLANDGTLEGQRFRGSRQPKSFTRRAAISADDVLTVSEFNAGTSSQSDVVAVRGGGVARYLAFWQPETELEVTTLRPLDTEPNLRGRFRSAQPLTVGGEAGYYWESTALISANLLGRNWMIDSTGANFVPFPRVWCTKLADEAFTTADFAVAANVSVSYEALTDPPVTAEGADGGDTIYRALWVPEDTPDVTGILSDSGFGGSLNLISGFTLQVGTVVWDGIDGKVWAENSGRLAFDNRPINNAKTVIQIP